jgi:hypothetical protein
MKKFNKIKEIIIYNIIKMLIKLLKIYNNNNNNKIILHLGQVKMDMNRIEIHQVDLLVLDIF